MQIVEQRRLGAHLVDGGLRGEQLLARGHGLQRLERISAPAALEQRALALRFLDRQELVEVNASTYLGPKTGRRVIDGQIHRGDGELIRAAVRFSDLRAFSELSERLPLPDLLALLDDAFEVQVACVEAHGGEVLQFMGDGPLAVFRHEDEAAACGAALAAAMALRHVGPDEPAAPGRRDGGSSRGAAGRDQPGREPLQRVRGGQPHGVIL